MNRTDRLLAIVLELQGKGRQRAEDLARTFETSKRTIYRDILALGESGVPLISTPGRGYSLMPGYFLPPLSFSAEEATMLLLGSDFMAQNFDAQYRAAAQSASRKIAGVLPEKLRDEVQYLQSNIRFVAVGSSGNPVEQEKLQLLRRAIIDHYTVHFVYHTRHSSEGNSTTNARDADPYGLSYFLGSWHLVAYCHLRQDRRVFRLDRIENLKILEKTFQRPAGFLMGPPKNETARNTIIRVLFDHEVARWVHETRPFYVTSEEHTPDGWLVTLAVRQESAVLQWLLSWGRHVRVLEPESVRQLLIEEAQGTLNNYQLAETVQEVTTLLP
jgi:predicted DNA-binding transcriptional regulator YafY